MVSTTTVRPDHLFEVSWEVCNKVGGIHTVIATKAKTLHDQLDDRYMLIGPGINIGSAASEFVEDHTLFRSWREKARAEGLEFRIGRWQIPGAPIVVLVDFTQFYTEKNDIFSDFWLKYQLDSLQGAWDYIEPAMFGYAAGKVVESFYLHHLNNTDKIVAQFHEWMTGTGILYLKSQIPQVATVFTTHATVLGRALAGSGVAFHSLIDTFVADKSAISLNVVSKHSLEKCAAKNADCFTTVSEITARECAHFLSQNPDVITPNGFDISIIPPTTELTGKRAQARLKLLEVAKGLYNECLQDDTIFVLTSGRYEFKNKGIDLFIQGLGALATDSNLQRTVVGVFLIPARQSGPCKPLLDRIASPDFDAPTSGQYLTHNLQDAGNDPILTEAKAVGLYNEPCNKVKLLFAPVYLDGHDGVFNMSYYDLLLGFDMAVFTSYYEPWGYTPLESIAFYLSSITSSLSGFGLAIKKQLMEQGPGIKVIERTDFNDASVVVEIAQAIQQFSTFPGQQVELVRQDAHTVSLHFLWARLIEHYEQAYQLALIKTESREVYFHNKPQVKPLIASEQSVVSDPLWRTISVELLLPQELNFLNILMRNLWWAWDAEAEALFRYIDVELWDKSDRNPMKMMARLSFQKMQQLAADAVFITMLELVKQRFNEYINRPKSPEARIAYFSMEYGLCSFLKLYSGGLGILAGDHLKQASDSGADLVALGLFYKKGFFKQTISLFGEQLAGPETHDLATLPMQLVANEHNEPRLIQLFFPGRTVQVQVWRIDVGCVPLYLMDTDLPQNSNEDRAITASLYDGDKEMRIKQEVLLGVGGIMVLNLLGITPTVYHCNEGHAAFITIERIYDLMKGQNLSFSEAFELTHASNLFTTHTSVPAANDLFAEEMMRKYLSTRTEFFNINWNQFMGYGRTQPVDQSEKFSMTSFGVRMSGAVNAVSKIHRTVSQHLLSPLWSDLQPEEINIGCVTNGVHYGTWAAKEWKQYFAEKLHIADNQSLNDSAKWARLYDMPDKEIWHIRKELKNKLIAKLRSNVVVTASIAENRARLLNSLTRFNENALFIGFARRFVAYKRSGLLFSDLDRLSRLISDPDRPVFFLFAGKAHPADHDSIKLIDQLVAATNNPRSKDNMVFLEDYNMDVAKLLVQGVDVWLNTPQRHTEASGTSGMKAALNGVLNFSVLDGWWAEAYNGSNGWSLSELPAYEDPQVQNQLDTETIFNTLEQQVIPLFFERNTNGLPAKWLQMVRSSIISIAPMFNMKRPFDEYFRNYYTPLSARYQLLKADNFKLAKEIAEWKKMVRDHWDEIDVIKLDCALLDDPRLMAGEEVPIKVVLEIGNLSCTDIGMEVIITNGDLGGAMFIKEFTPVSCERTVATFETSIVVEHSGSFNIGIRVYPKNPLLGNKHEMGLIKWV